MHARRQPLAEVDTWELWQAARRGEWQQVAPWLLLLAGFCAVLAGLASFFWLAAHDPITGETDFIAVAGLLVGLGGFAVFLYRRLSARRPFALGAVAGLLGIAGAIFGLWLLAFTLSGTNACLGILGVLVECGLGTTLGLAGINRLAPRE